MIFTSYTYLAFLLAAFVLHWLVPSSWRKGLIIVASYVFYCSWQWQFGFLLLFVSVFNWWYAKAILSKRPTLPRLFAGIAVNLAPLIYFKYTVFLVSNIVAVGGWMGLTWRPGPINIIVPLGISFFTFQGVAYLVDVATGDEPFDNIVDFLLFKAFWPQLIAGPIIRFHEIREQIETPRTLAYGDVADGCYRILRGFFKKVVLADNIAPVVDAVFRSNSPPHALDCAVGILGFGLQIYFDFSAYSEIAIGSARLFGYRFPENFAWPYASASPQEFWSRWHMTLSRWIRDYIFTPLNFAARHRPWLGHVWLILAMTLCGLWHKAEWTLVIWGAWHGVLLVLNQTVLRSFFPRPAPGPAPLITLGRLPGIAVTLLTVGIGWLLFRATSLEQCGVFLKSLATLHGGFRPSTIRENNVLLVAIIALALAALTVIRSRGRLGFLIDSDRPVCVWLRAVVYTVLILAVIVFDQEAKAFVYFQF